MGYYPAFAFSDIRGAARDGDIHAAAHTVWLPKIKITQLSKTSKPRSWAPVDFRTHQIGREGCKQASGAQGCGMKKKTAVRSSPSSTSSVDAILASSHNEIATRAEALWRKKGCPQGCDNELWLEAERQLRHVPGPGGEKRNRIALADPRFDFNLKRDDVMEELNERSPGQTGKETTSL